MRSLLYGPQNRREHLPTAPGGSENLREAFCPVQRRRKWGGLVGHMLIRSGTTAKFLTPGS